MNIINDGLINMAFGRSRNETRWKNKEILWSALLNKLKDTHRTTETYLEYMKSDKDRQAEIKDIGGFVGGHINGGRRKNGHILNRQLVTLDVDFGDNDFWMDFTLVNAFACAVYTTHKHSPDTPKYRILVPLDRPTLPDEYEAIARRIADSVDIDAYDPTTFRPTQLMYWPSTPVDGEYIFDYQDAPFACADDILATYSNWRDVSFWPESNRLSDKLKTNIAQQGDPMAKPGIVGLFCRAYTISEAIAKFLPDEYDQNGERYTFKKGSTASGLVIYDDTFAYSHHGSDPAGGKLCNAFDLVRLHKFGLQDADMPFDTPVNKLPSFKAMLDFASTDKTTSKLAGLERINAARVEFEEDSHFDFKAKALIDMDDPENDWIENISRDKNGNCKSTMANVITILENDPLLKGCYGYNDFIQKPQLLKDVPWRSIEDSNEISDYDDSCLRVYLERSYGMVSGYHINHGLNSVIPKNRIHPVREYLTSLEWDGIERLEKVFIEYLGAPDNEYTRAVTRKTLTAAVARIFEPGCKFDHVCTFVGEEGIGKSTIIDKLGREWASSSFYTFHGKEAFEQLQGVWLIEMGELSAERKSDVETVKHFVDKRKDEFRPAYGKAKLTFKRQCIFFATTNKKAPLRSTEGNRKFWIVNTDKNAATKSVFRMPAKIVNQIWAEAVESYRRGEELKLSPELEKLARTIQRDHVERDDREDLVVQYLNTAIPREWNSMKIYERRNYYEEFLNVKRKEDADHMIRQRVTILEIMQELFGLTGKELLPHACRPFHDIMKLQPNWVRAEAKSRAGGNPVVVYERSNANNYERFREKDRAGTSEDN